VAAARSRRLFVARQSCPTTTAQSGTSKLAKELKIMAMHQTPLTGLRARHDDSKGVTDFREYLVALAKGGKDAYTDAERLSHNPAVVMQLKTASPAASTTLLTSPFSLALTRLMATNSPRSAFNVMKANMTEVPLRTRVMVSGATINASEVAEGAAKLFRRLSVTNLDTETAKFAATVAITQEFIQEAPELAGRVLADVLSEAVSRSTDGYFLGKLNAAESGESDSAVDPSFASMLESLSELLRLVKTGEASRLYFIMRPTALKYLSSKAYEAGVTTVKYNGGEVMGVQLIASDSQTTGTITAADASGIVYGDDGIEVRSSDVAAVELNDVSGQHSVTPVQTTLVSCFQSNFRAVIAEQRIAVRVAALNCVASLTGVQWGLGGGSPDAL
jgi:aspartokinase-like uncharacterized kinase